MNLPVYLDYNSTTPVDRRVLESMLPYFTEKFGNAASKTHSYGWVADEAVKKARKLVADLIHSEPGEIIFTSGATEAINLALKGSFERYKTKGNHIVTVETEHKAVLDTCKHLEQNGATITYLPVDKNGLINIEDLKNAITEKTIVVCIMYANNETGVIQPVKKIAEIVHERNSLFMSDATQACGKIEVDIQEDGADMLCLSAHKFYGPKGIGALYVKRKNPRVSLAPLIDGGGHENGLRSGTLNVPAIVGLGAACSIAKKEMKDDSQRISLLRNELEKTLTAIRDVTVNGDLKNRLFNVSNLAFANVNANALMSELKNIAVAAGSACTSEIPEPSHVLKAMKIPDELAYSSIRFSLGKYSTQEEIHVAVKKIQEAVLKIRTTGI
jgi:cysteine desulfurase